MLNLWLIISIVAITVDIGVIGCNMVIYRQLKEIEEQLQVLLQIGEIKNGNIHKKLGKETPTFDVWSASD